MIISVYHNAFGDEFSRVATYVSNKSHVATALEEAFHLTNSVNTSWYDNDNLEVNEAFKIAGVRSTSVNDYIEVEKDGVIEWYRVASTGFTKVELYENVDYLRYENGENVIKTSRLIDLILPTD